MPALQVIISGDANKLKAEMDKINAWAAKTGQNVKTSLNLAGAGGTQTVNSGAMREAITLVREMSRGNWTRVPGSASILVQRLGLLRFVLNPVVGILAGIGAGFFAAYKIAGSLVDRMTGLKLPVLEMPTYIARIKQGINAATEAEKELNDEVARTIERFNSAEGSAERTLEIIKEEYEFQRKLNELKGGGPEKEAEINKKERNAILAEKFREQANLKLESEAKKRQADAMRLSSKEHDEEIAKQRNKLAEDAQKQLLELQNPGFKDKFLKADLAAGNFLLGGPLSKKLDTLTGADLDKARQGAISEAQRRIQSAKDWTDQMASNDAARKKREQIYKDAGSAAAAAAKLGLEIQHLSKLDATKNAHDAAIAAAKVAKEAVKNTRPEVIRGHLTENQRLGAYISPGSGNILVDVNRRQLRELQQINAKLARNGPGYGPAIGAANH